MGWARDRLPEKGHLSYYLKDDKRLRRVMGRAFVAEATARTQGQRRNSDTL